MVRCLQIVLSVWYVHCYMYIICIIIARCLLSICLFCTSCIIMSMLMAWGVIFICKQPRFTRQVYAHTLLRYCGLDDCVTWVSFHRVWLATSCAYRTVLARSIDFRPGACRHWALMNNRYAFIEKFILDIFVMVWQNYWRKCNQLTLIHKYCLLNQNIWWLILIIIVL